MFSSLNTLEELIDTLGRFRRCVAEVDDAGQALTQILRNGNKILTCGNGGSAADALHMAQELIGRYKRDRKSLAALCLAADPTALTCIGNDYGFESVFSRQVEGFGRKGDGLVLFSTSGNSANLIQAVIQARAHEMTTFAVLGKGGGLMRGRADFEIVVPSDDTARVQEVHTLILHSWLEVIDTAFSTMPEEAAHGQA